MLIGLAAVITLLTLLWLVSLAGRVMNTGLWRYTRHPNYFGEAVVWWVSAPRIRHSSSVAPEIRPLRLAVGSFAARESFAVIPGIRQVRKGRLRGTLGELSPEHLTMLDECLDAYLR